MMVYRIIDMCGFVSKIDLDEQDGHLKWACCVLVVSALAGGCAPARYKADADAEVYKIIDNKWHDPFGEKVNYVICDGPSCPNDLRVDPGVPSGVLSLPQAVAIATARNRDYQRQKEQLYLAALDLTLVRHQFARQWFGTVDASYAKEGQDEQAGSGGTLGFNQRLADGASISMGVALDWVRFLTGDRGTSLGSVLSASFTQPLLRGRRRRIAQEGLTQAERDVLYAIRSFNRFRETFVVSIVNDYYRVLQLRDIVTNAQNDYQRRVQSKERLEMESEAGRRPSFEIDQAVQETLRAQANVEAAEESEGRKIITIPDTSEMKVEIKIHETWIDKIAVGQPAKITVAAFPGKTFTGKVLKKAPLADLDNWLNPDLKAYVTDVGIEGADDALKTGMTGKVEVTIEKLHDVLYVPIQSVVSVGETKFCHVLGGGPEKREVQTGLFNDNFVEIKSGLDEGERVLLNPPRWSEELKAPKETEPARP